MKREDIFSALINIVDTDTALINLLGGHNIFRVYTDLPTVFPAIGLHYQERGSTLLASYDTFKIRKCKGELTCFIQVATTVEDADLLEGALDRIYLGKRIEGTHGWKKLSTYENIENDEKLQCAVYYKKLTYIFEYLTSDI